MVQFLLMSFHQLKHVTTGNVPRYGDALCLKYIQVHDVLCELLAKSPTQITSHSALHAVILRKKNQNNNKEFDEHTCS